MNKPSNYYEVLGVPENAALAVIKSRYRELVRVYHPDVAGNKTEAHRMFLRISEAYETLSDSVARGSYDRTLQSEREKERRKRDEAVEQRKRRYQRMEHGGLGVTLEQKKTAMQHIRNAQLAFIQRRLPTAVQLCKNALQIDPRNAQAHAVLGDVYKIRGKVELAIKHYSFAVQFNPSDRDIERKLSEVLNSTVANSPEEAGHTSGTSGYYRARMNMIGWTFVVGLLFAVKMLPSKTYIMEGNVGYFTAAWNWGLLPLLGIIGFITGFIFVLNGWVGSPSGDLFSVGRLVKGGGIRLGQMMFWISFLYFWVTACVYIAVALLRGDTSRSVTRLLTATVGILLMTALIYGSHHKLIIMWCGNLVFPCAVLGWYCGHKLNPMKRYGWSK